MNTYRSAARAALILLAGLWATVLMGLAPTDSQADRIVTTRDHNKIVVVNPSTRSHRTVRVVPRARITSLSTASGLPLIAYSTRRIVPVGGGLVRLVDNIWTMRGNGRHLRKAISFKRVGKPGQFGVKILKPAEDSAGSQQGVLDVDVSHDGAKLLFTRGFNLFEVKSSGGAPKLVNPGYRGVFDPEYDPSGKFVTASFDSGDPSGFGISRVGIKGKVRWLSRRGIDFFTAQPTFSSDGRTLAFGAQKPADLGTDVFRFGPTAIWLISRNGKNLRVVPATAARPKVTFEDPAFSVDGRTLAVTTTKFDPNAPEITGSVYAITLPNGRLRRVFHETRGVYDRSVAWLP